MERHEVVLLADASGVLRSFASVSAASAKTTADISKIGPAGTASLGKVTTAFSALNRAASGAAVASLIGFLSDSARASAEAEASVARLAVAFENAGSSVDLYSDKLAAAGQAALAMAFDDEEAADAIATITATTGDAAGAIDLLGLAMDLARAKGMSLAAASTLIGKVAAGNTASLTRYGIVLDENATKEEALAALQQKFGGQAEAYANTQAGSIAKLGIAYENFQERVGGVAGPLTSVLGILPGVSAGFSGIGAAAGAAGPLITKAGAALKGSAAAANLFSAATSSAGLATLGLTAVIGTAIVVWQGYQQAINDGEDANVAFEKSLESIGDPALIGRIRDLGFAASDLSRDELGDNRFKFWETGFADAEGAAKAWREELTRAFDIVEAGGGDLDALAATAAKIKIAITSGDLESIQVGTELLGDLGTVAERGSQQATDAVATLTAEFNAGRLAPALYAGSVDTWADKVELAGDTANIATGQVQAFTDAQKAAISGLASVLDRAASDQISAVQDAETAIVSAAEATADGQIAAAERAGAAQTRAVEQAGQTSSRAATKAGNEQVRAAEQAEAGQVKAADKAAAAQIANAQAAETAQVSAAESAAESQVAAAERAEQAQVKAAERAGQAQIRTATVAAHEQVRAANLAATAQVAQADRLEESVAASAKAREESIIESATAAHDALVERAESTADAEIAAAKRSTDKQLFELERRTAAGARAATDTASKALQDANDAAFKRIQGGGSVGGAANQLAKAQKDIYAQQTKDQEDVLRRAEAGEARIQAAEEKRIADVQAAKDAAVEASARRLAAIEEQAQAESLARTEAASVEAERMRTEAARNVAQVEKATAQEIAQVTRQAAQDAAQVTRQAAENTAAVQEATAANVAAVAEAAAANTARVTIAANREAEVVAIQTARTSERARTLAARNVGIAERQTGQAVRVIARETAAVQLTANAEREAVVTASAARIIAAEDRIQAESDATLLGLANSNAEAATLLVAAGEIRRGASGAWEVTQSPETQKAVASFNAIFGEGAAQLTRTGSIVIDTNWDNFDAELKQRMYLAQQLLRRPEGVSETNYRPAGVSETATNRMHGGVILPASNGRVVTVGENGREQVILPVGSRVRPNPATEASMGGGGISLNFYGPVYGMDDFEGQVGRAAAAVLSRALPAAISDRRRSLGS